MPAGRDEGAKSAPGKAEGGSYVHKSYPKMPAEQTKLRVALQKNTLFSEVTKFQLTTLVEAMRRSMFRAGQEVCKQGDPGEDFFFVDRGELDVFVTTDTGPIKVARIRPGETFGELALMYNSPRAATVKAATDCTLWALQRDAFMFATKKKGKLQRSQYLEFLKTVEMLQGINDASRTRLTDVMEERMFKQDEQIVTHGDVGEDFFIVLEGGAVARRGEHFLMSYARGQCFGERSLLTGDPRECDVFAMGECRVGIIKKDAFNKLLAPCHERMRQNMSQLHYTAPPTPPPPEPIEQSVAVATTSDLVSREQPTPDATPLPDRSALDLADLHPAVATMMRPLEEQTPNNSALLTASSRRQLIEALRDVERLRRQAAAALGDGFRMLDERIKVIDRQADRRVAKIQSDRKRLAEVRDKLRRGEPPALVDVAWAHALGTADPLPPLGEDEITISARGKQFVISRELLLSSGSPALKAAASNLHQRTVYLDMAPVYLETNWVTLPESADDLHAVRFDSELLGLQGLARLAASRPVEPEPPVATSSSLPLVSPSARRAPSPSRQRTPRAVEPSFRELDGSLVSMSAGTPRVGGELAPSIELDRADREDRTLTLLVQVGENPPRKRTVQAADTESLAARLRRMFNIVPDIDVLYEDTTLGFGRETWVILQSLDHLPDVARVKLRCRGDVSLALETAPEPHTCATTPKTPRRRRLTVAAELNGTARRVDVEVGSAQELVATITRAVDAPHESDLLYLDPELNAHVLVEELGALPNYCKVVVKPRAVVELAGPALY